MAVYPFTGTSQKHGHLHIVEPTPTERNMVSSQPASVIFNQMYWLPPSPLAVLRWLTVHQCEWGMHCVHGILRSMEVPMSSRGRTAEQQMKMLSYSTTRLLPSKYLNLSSWYSTDTQDWIVKYLNFRKSSCPVKLPLSRQSQRTLH